MHDPSSNKEVPQLINKYFRQQDRERGVGKRALGCEEQKLINM